MRIGLKLHRFDEKKEKYFFPAEEMKDWGQYYAVKCLNCFRSNVRPVKYSYLEGKYVASENCRFKHKLVAYCGSCGAWYLESNKIPIESEDC